MPDTTFSQRWRDYRASKSTLFWTAAACCIATIIIGFAWGGWVTQAGAATRADAAVQHARADLAASFCVARFMGAPDARSRLSTLKQTDTWQREDVVARGGWASLPGTTTPAPGVADLCAQRLVSMQLPPA
jgi:hypothetical protein